MHVYRLLRRRRGSSIGTLPIAVIGVAGSASGVASFSMGWPLWAGELCGIAIATGAVLQIVFCWPRIRAIGSAKAGRLAPDAALSDEADEREDALCSIRSAMDKAGIAFAIRSDCETRIALTQLIEAGRIASKVFGVPTLRLRGDGTRRQALGIYMRYIDTFLPSLCAADEEAARALALSFIRNQGG